MGAVAKLPSDCTPAQDARFRVILAHVMGEEGALADSPGDRGGVTNYGVTLRFLQGAGRIDPQVAAAFDLDHTGDLDEQDVRDLTPELAAELYERCLWVRTGYLNLPQPFDGALFDQAVNCGVVGANKLLQTALNAVSQSQIKVDGALGDQTLTALRVALTMKRGPVLIQALRKAAMDHYRAICRADPEQLRFLDGWLNRAEALGNV